jgi:hypothetical protein
MLTDADIRALIAEQQRRYRRNAIALADAARRGDAETFFRLAYPDDALEIDWPMAMRRIGRLGPVSEDIRAAFLTPWIEHKMWSLKIGNRRVLADALHVLMPPSADQGSLKLYRGAGWRERRGPAYGFSWTQRREIAASFADHWRQDADGGGGVILETIAPSEAILLIREAEDYYDEGEVVVDPFRLGAVSVAERLR